MYWNISRYNQDVRFSFPYCDNYKSTGHGKCQVITCQMSDNIM